jgi:hypothetical protein
MDDQQLGLIGYVLALNFFLSGLSKALEVVKDKTKTKADDKVWLWVNKLAGFSQAVVDFFSANPKHK